MHQCYFRPSESQSQSQAQNQNPIDHSSQQAFDDSLSSLSIDSMEDETNILNQAIAAGARTLSSHQAQYRNDPNDSYSSLDSCDDQQNRSLLEQAVQSGINKVMNANQISHATSSSKKTFEASKNNGKHERLNDEQLLEEVVNTGICKTTGQSQRIEISSQPVNIPKNVKSPTSVALSEKPGVGKETNAFENAVFQHQHQQQHRLTEQGHHSSGSNSVHSVMYRSNEYPALKLSAYEFSENSCADSYMEMSNEFMIDKGTLAENNFSDFDKRKNPDLMVASVDRLTKQLVDTAEYLRQTDPNCIRELKNISSTHTWNEDSASFPSISLDAPMIGSVNDEDNTFNDIKSTCSQNKLPVDEPTPTNETREFTEKVSGEKGRARDTKDDMLKQASLEATLRYDEIDGFSIDTVRHDSQFEGK